MLASASYHLSGRERSNDKDVDENRLYRAKEPDRQRPGLEAPQLRVKVSSTRQSLLDAGESGGGAKAGCRVQPQVVKRSSHVCGAMKSRGVPTPADSTMDEEVRGKGGSYTVGSPAAGRIVGSGADTAVSIEREVVSGHAYAVLAPESLVQGWCGYDNPTFPSVDGV
jgi:hypothetical protein